MPRMEESSGTPRPRRLLLVLPALLALSLLSATPAGAAFPGANGKLAFTSFRDGNDEVYAMNADGSGQTNLTNHPANDVQPAWSPDGQRIVFTSTRDGADEVYVMNADGSGPTNLTNQPTADRDPDWQPLAIAPPPAGGDHGAPSPAAPPPAGVALHVNRGTIAYRGLLRLSGHMGNKPDQPVTIERRPADQSRAAQTDGFRAFKQLLTGGQGGFETAFRMGTSQQFRITGPDGTSQIQEIAVRPRVATLLRGGRLVRGRTFTAHPGEALRLALRVTPMKRQLVFRVERRTADGDYDGTQRRVIETRRGRANVRFDIEREGTYRVRVLSFGDRLHAAGRSHPVTITVRTAPRA